MLWEKGGKMATLKNNMLEYANGDKPFVFGQLRQQSDADGLYYNGLNCGYFTNAPTDRLSWLLVLNMTADTDNAWVAQIWCPYDADTIYFRRRVNGVWQSWKQLAVVS